MDALSEFLRQAAARPFRLGEFDCGLFLADWYMAKTGKPDPAAHLRGASYGEDELTRHLQPIIENLALKPTQQPQSGDIGLLQLGGKTIGAICSGPRWMFLGRGVRSVQMGRVPVVAAWELR